MQPSFPIHQKYLSHLGEEEIDQLSSIMQYRTAAKNEILIHAGRHVKDVYYIQKGLVRLFMLDESGSEINTHLAWDGMFITSYYSLINNKLSDEAVAAITACELFHFTYVRMRAWLPSLIIILKWNDWAGSETNFFTFVKCILLYHHDFCLNKPKIK